MLLGIYLAALGGNDLNVGLIFNNLGCIHLVKGDREAAIDFYRKALNILEQISRIHFFTGLVINNLGKAIFTKNHYHHAHTHFVRALRIMRDALGDKDPETIKTQAYEKLTRRLKATEVFRI